MLLEIAAMLDRHDRALRSESNGQPRRDQRLDLVYKSLELLADHKAEPNRAERLLNLYSDPT
jgi:hypothetical protein